MAHSDKEKDHDSQDSDDHDPQESDKQDGTSQKKSKKPKDSPTEKPESDIPAVNDKEPDHQESSADELESSGERADKKDKAVADSSEKEQDHLEDEKSYGEEYYYDGSRPSQEDSHPKVESDPLVAQESDKKPSGETKKKNSFDDDENDEIPEGNPEKKMPFLDHLEELRWTLLRSLIAVVLGSIVCFIFNEKIIAALRWVAPDNMKLVILAPTEGFMISIKVAMFAGLVLALPVIAYEFWKFIVPGLLAKEKKLVPPIAFFTVLCFLVGGTFSYFVILRFALSFLLSFQQHTENMIAIGKYLGFVVTLILVFGVVFELPVLSYFLTKVGILTPEFLRTKRRYSIVVIFIVAAVLTPPDVLTQLLLAGPLLVLYEISIWVSAMVVRRKKQVEDED